MYQIKKRLSIAIGIAVVIIVTSVFVFTILTERWQPSEIVAEETSHRVHLETFLEDSGLISVGKEKDGFIYYELRDTYGDLQGFIFLGEEEGFGGPIKLFVKTDLEGIIQKVHIWQHSETPIYVHPIKLEEFLNTFANHKIDAELKWQTDVHGITGATVTAEAIIRGVRKLGIRTKEEDIYDIP